MAAWFSACALRFFIARASFSSTMEFFSASSFFSERAFSTDLSSLRKSSASLRADASSACRRVTTERCSERSARICCSIFSIVAACSARACERRFDTAEAASDLTSVSCVKKRSARERNSSNSFCIVAMVAFKRSVFSFDAIKASSIACMRFRAMSSSSFVVSKSRWNLSFSVSKFITLTLNDSNFLKYSSASSLLRCSASFSANVAFSTARVISSICEDMVVILG